MKWLKDIFARTYFILGLYNLSLRKKIKEKSITVLCFHLVNNDSKLSYPALRVSEFENILKYLKTNYTIISFDDIEKCLSVPASANEKPFCIISFDDGYRDFYENALPLLKKYDFVSNLNVVYDAVEKNDLIWTQKIHCILEHLMLNENISELNINNVHYKITPDNLARVSNDIINDLLNKDDKHRNSFIEDLLKYAKKKIDLTPVMNWIDVLDSQLKNVIIGSHTLSHAAFNERSGDEYLTREIVNSKTEIEERVKKKIDIIALPNGLFNKTVIEKCCDTGYKYILLVEGGYKSVTAYKGSFLVKRVLIHHNNFYENVLDIEHVYFYIKRIFGKK